MLSTEQISQIKSAFVTYGKETEVEFRLGRDVDKRTFNRFLNKFSSSPKEEQNVEDFIDKEGVRKRILLARPEREESTTWFIKRTVVPNFDSPLYPFRLSISREQKVSPKKDFRHVILRRKYRRSYLITGGLFRLDLTTVEEITKYSKTRLEIELEVLSASFRDEQLKATLVFLLSLLLDTNYLYTEEQKEDVLKRVNKVLGGRGINTLDPAVLVQSRNLKLEDMVWGGLIGNSTTTYSVTHKADGIRKLLVVDQTGIWFIMPPAELNLIKNVTDPDIIGTILDGEYVPPENRTYQMPVTKYWFLAFDCLSYPVPGGKSYNVSIQLKDLNSRLRCCQIVADRNKDSTLYVNSKSFHNFHNPEGFYKLMRDMFAEQPSLGYKQDGFIFTPLNAPYNPYSEKFPLHERVLTSIPDNVKWKPPHLLTIDLSIRWIAERGSRRLEVRTSERKDNRFTLVPFVGTKRNPVKHVETTGLEDVPTNTIVEFAVNPETSTLIPLKVREKLRPNRKEVAIDVWKDVFSPLTEKTLKGDDFTLLRRYHNNIKRELLESIPSGSTLLDLGSGRGADVGKWRSYKLVIAVEPSKERLDELLERSESIGLTNVITLQAKAQETDKIIGFLHDHVPEGKVDAVSMLLSMTFFWENEHILASVINTTKQALKPGGTLLFFTINGTAVEEVFNPKSSIPITSLKLGDNTLSFSNKQLTLNFPGTIIENQTEPLVFLEDLMHEFNLDVSMADKQKFLTPEETIFTRLYSYGKGNLRESLLSMDEEEISSSFTVDWTEGTFHRLVSLPGQAPFFAYLKGFSEEYRNQDIPGKYTLVTKLRTKLANDLPDYYARLNKGSVLNIGLLKKKFPEAASYTISSLQKLLSSRSSLPLFVYPFLAKYFEVDIYLLKETPYFFTTEGKYGIILIQIEDNIELVAAEREEELVTVFELNDPILAAFRKTFHE